MEARYTETFCFETAELSKCPVCSQRQSLTNDSVHKDEEEREEDETRVPHPDGLIDGRDAEEHEDDGF